MKKATKIITAIAVSSALALPMFTACGQNLFYAEPEPAATSAVTAETLSDEEKSLITGDYNNDKVTEKEAYLGVTPGKKVEFSATHGYETYDVAMQSLPYFLGYTRNKDTSLSKTALSGLDEKYTAEQLSIKSTFDGHDIPADYITLGGDKNRDTVIVVHGLGENRRQPIAIIEMFLDMGYNVLAYDQRASGENTAPYNTYGVLEHYDAVDYVKYVRSEIGDKKIILFGRSMGGATAAMVLGEPEAAQEVSAVILDYPVGSFREMIRQNTRGFCPDEYIEASLECDDLFMQYFLGISFDMGEVSGYVADTDVPVLIFTSKGDKTVDMSQPQSIYDAIKGDKKYIYIDAVSDHCGLVYTNTQLYKDYVTKFLSGELV